MSLLEVNPCQNNKFGQCTQETVNGHMEQWSVHWISNSEYALKSEQFIEQLSEYSPIFGFSILVMICFVSSIFGMYMVVDGSNNKSNPTFSWNEPI